MRIAFDVDGVFTDIEKYQLTRGKKYFKNIPEEKEEIIGVFLKSIVERERVLKKNELANDVLRVLIYLVAKEAESEENVQEDTMRKDMKST